MPESLLLVCRSPDASPLVEPLTRRGYRVQHAASSEAALRALQGPEISLAIVVLPLDHGVLSDLSSPLRAAGRPFVVVGTDDEVHGGTEAFEQGASDYLPADAEPHEVLASLGVALGSRRGDMHLRYLRDKSAVAAGWSTIVGRSSALLHIVSTLRQVCLRSSSGATPTIFLQGETGTGKGFFARCIHDNGARRNQPFVDVNCAALPASQLESELFGYERGAVPDARAPRPGLFETADRGTLFLDEVSALPLDLQAKLLTTLEDKSVRRIGARQSIPVNVQLVAASRENLGTLVRAGKFREDLSQRFHIVAIKIPPLRERREDIVLLAESFLEKLCRDYAMPPRSLAPDASEWIQSYRWPGNVRELRNQIERIVLLENDPFVRAEHFVTSTAGLSSTPPPPSTQSLPPPSGRSLPPPSGRSFPTTSRPTTNSTLIPTSTEQPTGRRQVDITRQGATLRVSLPASGVPLEDLEREVLRQALEVCQGNVSRAARFLSISRQTLIYRMKKYNLGHGAA